MKLIIVRHGETIENLNKICQDQIGGQLSANGLKQAKELAKRLKDRKLDAIYSSEAKRATDTCQEILAYHPKLKINLDQRINERHFGKLQGNIFPANWSWDNLPKDCETEAQTCQRVKKFMADIYLKHKNETVLVVSHGDIILAFLSIILKKSFAEIRTQGYPRNTALSEFDITENEKHSIHTLNCIKHLK